MTRFSEILKASKEYCDPFIVEQPTVDIAFQKGAEWADEHPKKNLVEIEKAWNWFNTKVLRILPKSIREKIKESFYKKMQENF